MVTLRVENPALTESIIKQNINSNDVCIDLAPFMLSTQLRDIRMILSHRECILLARRQRRLVAASSYECPLQEVLPGRQYLYTYVVSVTALMR